MIIVISLFIGYLLGIVHSGVSLYRGLKSTLDKMGERGNEEMLTQFERGYAKGIEDTHD